MSNNRVLPIIRKLANPGAMLIPKRPGDDIESGVRQYELTSPVQVKKRKVQTVSAELVRDWASEGLIEPCGKAYKLSQAGIGWLKRRLSSTGEFHHQHQERKLRVIESEGLRKPVIVNDNESPLRWLASRKDKKGVRMLSSCQVEAGERLRADYEFAGLRARVTASWSPTAGCNSSSGTNDAAGMQENVMAARQRVVRAIAAVGPELSGVLVDVCCHLKGLEEAEKAEGWPQRSGKVVLQMALTRLARHYGLISDKEANHNIHRRLQHWGTQDYRPVITPDEMVS